MLKEGKLAARPSARDAPLGPVQVAPTHSPDPPFISLGRDELRSASCDSPVKVGASLVEAVAWSQG